MFHKGGGEFSPELEPILFVHTLGCRCKVRQPEQTSPASWNKPLLGEGSQGIEGPAPSITHASLFTIKLAAIAGAHTAVHLIMSTGWAGRKHLEPELTWLLESSFTEKRLRAPRIDILLRGSAAFGVERPGKSSCSFPIASCQILLLIARGESESRSVTLVMPAEMRSPSRAALLASSRHVLHSPHAAPDIPCCDSSPCAEELTLKSCYLAR